MIVDISLAIGRYALKKVKEAKEREDLKATEQWLELALREAEREELEKLMDGEDETRGI